jgi:Cys-tRNA(Pro)/Cys-tRNA(Cys) deacylase
VAAAIDMPPSQVFKTLAVRGEHRGVLLAVVPGDAELDFKALARLAGDKSVEMVPLKEVQPLTGYIRGGVTALACKKDYPVFIDESSELLTL